MLVLLVRVEVVKDDMKLPVGSAAAMLFMKLRNSKRRRRFECVTMIPFDGDSERCK